MNAGNEVQSICSATNWWAEFRVTGHQKLVRRLPIAAWALTAGNLKAVCFDGETAFLAEDDDDLKVTYRYGADLKQLGNGIPLDEGSSKRKRK